MPFPLEIIPPAHRRRALRAWVPAAFALATLLGCARAARVERADHTVLYAGVGELLMWYNVNAADATLARRGTVTLPAVVQYAWTHPSRRLLYVAWSDIVPGSTGGTRHGVTAFAIDPVTGALTERGTAAPLRSRPIHLTIDGAGTHVLVAHNEPSSVTVLALRSDGTIGSEVVPPAPLALGVYAHQVRVDPSDSSVFVVTRGIAPTASAPERPGAITVLRYADGVLTKDRSIAPGGGVGFQSRNIDFHPTRPWVYLVLERQNALQMFARRSDGSLPDSPRASVSTLDDSAAASASQLASAVAVHPNGRVAYVANRASSTRDRAGTPVFAGGVNSIAVFALDSTTGLPTRIANAATEGFSPRTFALDARGSLLVVANSAVVNVLDDVIVRPVPASLAVFHVGTDGRLAFARKYDMDLLPRRTLMWVGLVDLP